jgi:hypothetical protein
VRAIQGECLVGFGKSISVTLHAVQHVAARRMGASRLRPTVDRQVGTVERIAPVPEVGLDLATDCQQLR